MQEENEILSQSVDIGERWRSKILYPGKLLFKYDGARTMGSGIQDAERLYSKANFEKTIGGNILRKKKKLV